MALYEVKRTDTPGPGEFVEAVVIASGTAQARAAVAHMGGVIVKGAKCNVTALRMSTTGGVAVLSAYFDESPTLDDALTADEYAGDVSQPGTFDWR